MTNDNSDALEVGVIESADEPGAWHVEAVEIHRQSEGRIWVTVFSGPDAEQRARDYAAWKYASPPPPTLPDLEGVKEALRPFAKIADELESKGELYHMQVQGWRAQYGTVNATDFRRARSALQALEAKNV